MKTDAFRIAPESDVSLDKWPTAVARTYASDDAYRRDLNDAVERIAARQRLMFADGRRALLVILQGMDASGKDGIVRHVFSGVNPSGCHVKSFKRPSEHELAHDFLWRTTLALPERGAIGVFNRSYYEEVLVARVHPHLLAYQGLSPTPDAEFWKERYRSIREHETHLVRNGTTILKFFLHMSKDEQKQRFLDRIDEPDRNYKFNAGDLAERAHWDRYMSAFEQCLSATSSNSAPWYAIPADQKKQARLIIARVVADTLAEMDLRPPPLDDERRAGLIAARAGLVGAD